jgi:hypothetical protein
LKIVTTKRVPAVTLVTISEIVVNTRV